MFSVEQKRDISTAVQKILRETHHPELPDTGEIMFTLKVAGAASWSWAEIHNNGSVGDPGVNPHNEAMAELTEEEGREKIKEATGNVASEGQTPYMPDPSDTPDTLMQEMLKQQIGTLSRRIFKVEEIVVDYNKRLNDVEDRDKINRKLYSEVRFGLDTLQEFLTPIMEDNLIQHHDDQLRNMMTAMKQLGNPKISKTLKGD